MNTAIVIPCYNEAVRFSEDELATLCAGEGIDVLLVDDGSTDTTASRLREFEQRYHNVRMLSLPVNAGKAEAVRLGLQEVVQGYDMVGFLDADFSTSAEEMLRLTAHLKASEAKVLLAARWLHLGVEIHRSPYRHYLGRVFATWASVFLDMPVYDTQCGAKLFRATPVLQDALARSFRSRWVFDVELIARLKLGGYDDQDFVEEGLNRWVDQGGSRIKLSDLPDILMSMISLWREYRGLRT